MVWRVGGFWLGTVRITYTMSFACINTRIDSKCAVHCVQVSNLVMIQYHTIISYLYGNNICVTHLNIIQEMRSCSNGKKAHECHSVCVYVSSNCAVYLFSIYNENLSNNYHVAIC